ncbi:MAG: HAMP domain-containing protein [bacterium]
MKIGQKLSLSFFVIIALLWAVSIVSINSYYSIHKTFEKLKEEVMPSTVLMVDMQIQAGKVHLSLMEYIAHHYYDDLAETIKTNFAAEKQEIIKTAEEHCKRECLIGDSEKSEAGKIMDEINDMNSSADGIIAYLDSVPKAEHTEAFHRSVADKEETEYHPKYVKLMERLRKHEEMHIQELAEAEEAVHKAHTFGVTLILITSVLTTLLGIILAMFITRSITKPVTLLKNTSLELGKGNLSARAEIKSKDEIGELAGSFNKMAQDLKTSRKEIEDYSRILEKKVAERTEELRHTNEELETTNEELRQTNEELESLAEELRVANEAAQKARQLAEKKADDFERFNKVAVGREIKMKELKIKIAELEKKLDTDVHG